jgi:protein-tyrosine phosphatase
LQAVIDLHSHILPGLDDGAQTIEDSRELARRAAAEGVTAVAATPHVRSDYPTTADEMELGVDALRADFGENGIPIQVLHGGEVDIVRLSSLGDDELRRFTLAQSGRYLLIEFPYSGWPAGMDNALFGVGLSGFIPILAHPERNGEVQRDPTRLRPTVERGALVQLTAASVDGRLGRSSKAAAKRLLELGLAHLLASDAHTPAIREAGLAAAAAALGDEGLARYLTQDAPAAIVAGEALPEHPRPGRRRRFVIF